MAEMDFTKPQVGRWASSGIVVALGGLVSVGPDDTLRWQFDIARLKWKAPPENLLEKFAELWRSKPSAIIAFAAKWGPLRIDSAGKEVKPGECGSEPLAAWRYLSRRAYSVLRIVKDLERGEIGSDDDWDFLTSVLMGKTMFGLPEVSRWDCSEHVREMSGYSDPVSYAKAAIAGEVSNWLQQFDVRLMLGWDKQSSWQIKMKYGGRMISAVALQLAFAVARGDRLFTCSGCGKPYRRPDNKRKPNAGHANFCPECIRKKVPQREAEKRYRENRREAIKSAEAGMSARMIADKLGRTTDVVRAWIKKKG